MKRKSSVVLVVILIMALFCGAGCGNNEAQSEVDNRLTVGTAVVKEGSISKEVTYSGSIKGANEVTLYPKAAARVVSIHLREGDRVSKGQTIISLDTTDYQTGAAAAEATLAAAEANYQNVKSNVDRTRALFEQGGVSSQQMEQAELGLIQADTAVQQAQVAMDNAQNMLNNCQITSPINGVVGLIQITEGNMASPQAPVAVVSSTGKMAVKINVSETDIGYVSANSEVRVKVSSIPGQEFPGRVTSIATVVSPLTKGFPVEITLDNPDNLLKSGMVAEIRLSTQQKDGVLTISRGAVVEKGARRVVFTVDEEAVVHETEIEVGLENNDFVEVISGLSPGDQVVVKGQTLLNDLDEVRLAEGQV